MRVLSKLEDLISAVQPMPHSKLLKQISFLLLLDEVTVHRSNVFQSVFKRGKIYAMRAFLLMRVGIYMRALEY